MNTIFENFFTSAFVIELGLSVGCWGWTYLVSRVWAGMAWV